MILLAISLIAAALSDGSETRALELTSDYRFALLSGIESQVGGKFIITGLAQAESTCALTRACATGQDVINSTGGAATTGRIRNVGELASNTRIYGRRPVAVVSLRSKCRDFDAGCITASVYDPATGQWGMKIAIVAYGGPVTFDGAAPGMLRLEKWSDLGKPATATRR